MLDLSLAINIGTRIGGFSPATLFAASEPGGWYDPSDLTTLYQDSAGTTPVTAAGQSVGLWLDKSRGLVLGSERASNGDFSSGTDWSLDAGASIGSGLLTFASVSSAFGASYAVPSAFSNGQFAQVTVKVDSVAAGQFRVRLNGGSFFVVPATPGTYTFYLQAGSGGNALQILALGTTSGTIDNISIRELPGNHLSQSSSGQRAIYGVEPVGGRRNLLTQTETGTGWTADSTTFATGLPGVDGFTSGSFSFSNGTTNYPRAGLEATSGVQITCSAWIWVTSGTVSVRPAAYYSGAWQLLGAGDLTVTSTPQRFTWTYTPTTNTSFGSGFALRTIYSGGTGTVRVSGAQLETGSTATAYQRVVTAFDVTEAGVASLSYIQFDGSDDGYVSPTITPGIDKAQVFAGVRKLSDATAGIIVESSATVETNAGTIIAFTNPSTYGVKLRGTSNPSAVLAPTSYPVPITNVITGLGDISADVNTLRINGAQEGSSTADQGTGNYLAYPLYVGRRGGSSLPYNGRIYGLVVRFGANLSASQITSMEAWLNQKTGAY